MLRTFVRFVPLAACALIAPSASAQLHSTTFPDGTGTVGLPSGWTIRDCYHGEVSASNASQDSIVLGMAWNVLDPSSPYHGMPGNERMATARPGDLTSALRALLAQNGTRLTSLHIRQAPGVNGGPGAIMSYEFVQGGKRYAAIGYFAALEYSGSSMWQLYSSALIAPKARFLKQLPTMMAIWKSWHPNGQPPTPGSSSAIVDGIIKDRQDSFEKLNKQFHQYILG